jgi:L-iditol 2-dehydrogenase
MSSVQDAGRPRSDRQSNETVPPDMRAALLRDWNDLSVETVQTPELAHGEVLLRVGACGICGTDLKIVSGGFAGTWPPSLPFVLGHEWAGRIVALGPGTEDSDLRPGDRVAAENHAGCGLCRMCRAGQYNLCERVRRPGYKLYGHTAPGALAEYAVRPAKVLHKLPDSVSDEAGALVNQGALTIHAVRRTGLDPGSSVAVFGPGLLGLMMAQVARASGAAEVIVVGRGERVKLAAELTDARVVDYQEADPVEAIRDLTGGRGVDRVYECAGNPTVVPQGLAAVRRGGRVALLGLTGAKGVEISPDTLTLNEIDLMGIRSSPNAYPAIIALLASGAVDVEPLLTHVYPLEQVEEAFAALRDRTAIRPILKP